MRRYDELFYQLPQRRKLRFAELRSVRSTMKTLVGAVLGISIFVSVALAIDSSYKTRLITTATLTINVKDGVYLTITNFTQDTDAPGQRGVVLAGIVPSTPTPAATPTPTLSTTAGPGVALSTGGVLTDSATLFGDTNPNGQITFTLLDPTVSPVYTDVVTVSSNGTFTTAQGNNPGGFSPKTTGTYTWTALYTGDTNGNPAASAPAETVIVTATPTPPATPTPTPTPVFAGILNASISNEPFADFIKPIVVAGPATLTINPVPPAKLTITYRKTLQPSGVTPTPTSTSTPGQTATPTPTVAALSVGSSTTSSQSVTTIESTVSDDEDTFSATPTPTATPTPGVSRRVQTVPSTPTATPLITPTPTPIPQS